VEASALSAPAGLRRFPRPAVRLLRLRSDDQLVAAFRAGDDDAFQAIHDRYRQRLFAYTRQMLPGSRQDAEDALQDVWFRAYAALRADERPVTLRAWLYRVAHNRCIDQLRRPVPVHSDVFDVTRKPLQDPLEEAAQREDLRRLVSDVRRLPEAQRSALLMRELEGLTYEELAAALDTTIPAIKSLLVRARIGLVEAAEARDTACVDIQQQLLMAYDKGVRASSQARRHMRECQGCRRYRTELRGVRRSFAALAPGGGLLALIGLGGGAAGAGGGGAAAAGGGGAAATIVGGSAAVATSAKVVAVVASVAVVTAGAAEEVRQRVAPAKPNVERVAPAPAAAAPVAARHAPAVVVPGKQRTAERARRAVTAAPVVDAAPIREPLIASAMASGGEEVDVGTTGGFVAPDEPATPPPSQATQQDGAQAHGPLSLITSAATGSPNGGGSAKTEAKPDSGSGSASTSSSSSSSSSTSTSSGTTESGSGTGPRAAGTGSGSSTPGP
jgi:RNA polymerase sigma factor (sigma-70 family)